MKRYTKAESQLAYQIMGELLGKEVVEKHCNPDLFSMQRAVDAIANGAGANEVDKKVREFLDKQGVSHENKAPSALQAVVRDWILQRVQARQAATSSKKTTSEAGESSKEAASSEAGESSKAAEPSEETTSSKAAEPSKDTTSEAGESSKAATSSKAAEPSKETTSSKAAEPSSKAAGRNMITKNRAKHALTKWETTFRDIPVPVAQPNGNIPHKLVSDAISHDRMKAHLEKLGRNVPTDRRQLCSAFVAWLLE